jgi:hypothetical protein
MNDNTFIKVFRKLSEWEWYQDSKMVHLFIHLLLHANYKDNRWRGIPIKRGQLPTGIDSLYEKTHISKQSIRTRLKRLKSTGEITIKPTNNFSIITLCHYELYQNKNSQINKQTNKQLTINQQTDNKQITTLKEGNNVRKKEDIYTPPSLASVKEYFKENGYSESIAIKAFNYYSSNDWKDKNGNKVKNWKQKMHGVWFTEENKKKDPSIIKMVR